MLSAGSPSSSQNARHSRRKPRKPRGRGLRSSSGCLVCRARRVKCDEVKPVCGPCSKRSRSCTFESESAKTPTETYGAVAELPSLQQLFEDRATAGTSNVQSQFERGSGSIVSANSALTSGNFVLTPHEVWTSPRSEANTASPQSARDPGWSDENAPFRWFGLLVDDAGHDTLSFGDAASPETNRNQQQSIPGVDFGADHGSSYYPSAVTRLDERAVTSHLVPSHRDTVSSGSIYLSTGNLWQSPVKLRNHEIPIFRRFVNRLSHWIDIFDPMEHFSTLVPHIAMNNEGLMKAVLGLSARHMSIRPSDSEPVIDRTTAVQYYYETLQYLQHAMKHQPYTRSLELTATAHIVSMYEMIDGTGSGWERHLKGVFWIQRSQNIGAETSGLQGAGWWAWLRQDVWAAFREGRRVYSIHKHVKTYAEMTPYELAARAVYLLAEAVNYSSNKEIKDGENNLPTRIERGAYLCGMIHEWHHHLTVHFNPLPWATETNKDVFTPRWINPPEFGAAVQIANMAKVLILVHKPAPGGLRECLGREHEINEAIDTICGIALTIKDEPATVLSTQCLYASGLYTHLPVKRQAILELIGAHQDLTGWPVRRLEDDLKAEWRRMESV